MTVHSAGSDESRVNELSVEVHNQHVKASFCYLEAAPNYPLIWNSNNSYNMYNQHHGKSGGKNQVMA